MSGLTLTLTAVDAGPLERRLAQLLRRLGDLTPLMSIIAGYLRDSTRYRFSEGVAPDGTPWTPSIRVRLHGGQTLVQHGILRDRIVDDHGRDFAAAGTNDIRAPLLHFGGVVRPKTASALVFQLPGGLWRSVQSVTIHARPIFGLSRADEAEIPALVDDYVEGAVA